MRASLVSLALAGVLLAPPPLRAATPDPAATAQTHALFQAWRDWTLERYPTWGIDHGEDRFPDRLTDESPAAARQRRAEHAEFLVRALRLDEAGLAPPDRTSLRVLRDTLQREQAMLALHGALPFDPATGHAPLTQMGGLHLDLARLASGVRIEGVRDVQAWLARLRAVPAAVDGLIARLQAAAEAGWMPPAVPLARVPEQIGMHLGPDPRRSPLFEPLTRLPAEVPAAERARLEAEAEAQLRQTVVPALQRLQRFYAERYIPRARATWGESQLPPGRALYQAQLNAVTTTTLTPEALRDLGLAEVQRIGAEMDALVKTTGFAGTRAQFQHHLNTDPRFFFTRADDMLAAYRDIAKRADAALPALFAELPRQTYGIRAMRPEEGDSPEYYTPGAADGSRPGWFEANTNDLTLRPIWAMETLLLHEAVPGHHLQGARAQELRDLPDFRRHGWQTAYGEGWALYAESLGEAMGFYRDPYQRYGHLSYAMLRAARLVVDTGLHAFGWTRDQAIEYLIAQAGLPRGEAVAEVDRYLVWPGQATAYKVGERHIRALRERARAALGERFDLRRFHNAVLDGGALPLDVLTQQIDGWIETERRSQNRR